MADLDIAYWKREVSDCLAPVYKMNARDRKEMFRFYINWALNNCIVLEGSAELLPKKPTVEPSMLMTNYNYAGSAAALSKLF